MTRRELLAMLAGVLPAGATAHAMAQPGPHDLIVVESDRAMSQQETKNIAALVARVCGGHKVIVLDRGLSLRVERGAT